MKKPFRNLALFASAVILLLFTVFVINQTAQVVELASRVSPAFGTAVLWALLVFYAILIMVPAVLFLRLPRSLLPPASEDAPEFPAYLEALKKRLAANPRLKGCALADRQQVGEAITFLEQEADDIIQRAASNVFITTAVSQSGRLDAFLVLSAQSRMVWQIARLFYQRPTPRELMHLYANVAATTFVAGEIDDLDINEQIQPVLSSALGVLAGSVPGLQVATSIVVSSVLTGTTNAFLTLRVGIIAKRYCGSLVSGQRRTLRRAATTEAAKLLTGVVKQGTARVSRAVWEASKDKVGTAASGAKDRVKDAGKNLLSTFGFTPPRKPQP